MGTCHIACESWRQDLNPGLGSLPSPYSQQVFHAVLISSHFGVCCPGQGGGGGEGVAAATSVNTALPSVCKVQPPVPSWGCLLIYAYFFIKMGILQSQSNFVFREALSPGCLQRKPSGSRRLLVIQAVASICQHVCLLYLPSLIYNPAQINE